MVAIVIVVILVIVVSGLLWSIFTRDVILFVLKRFQDLEDLPFPITSFIYYSYIMFIQLSFMPVYSWSCVIISFVQGNFFHTSIIMFFANLSASMFFFYLSSFWIGECIKKRYKDDLLFKLVLIEGKRRPLITCVLVRTLFIPIGYKNCVLPLCGVRFYQFIFVSMIHNLMVSSLLILIGVQLKDINDYLEPSKFTQKTLLQQIIQVLSMIAMPLTLIILISMSIYGKYRFNAIKREEL